MGFEKGEMVCKQGEDATEMYIVVSGMLVGEMSTTVVGSSTRTSKSSGQGQHNDNNVINAHHNRGGGVFSSRLLFPSKSRRICVGGSVNTLHALGVWPQCLETVTAQQETETYALSEADMRSLFMGSNTDKGEFEEIKLMETMRFAFVPNSLAPTEFGKPLYFSCFSTVELALVSVRGAFRGTGPLEAAKRALADRNLLQLRSASNENDRNAGIAGGVAGSGGSGSGDGIGTRSISSSSNGGSIGRRERSVSACGWGSSVGASGNAGGSFEDGDSSTSNLRLLAAELAGRECW
jgi:hypothetical protein